MLEPKFISDLKNLHWFFFNLGWYHGLKWNWIQVDFRRLYFCWMRSYQNVPLCSASKKEEIHFPNADHHAKIKSKCKDCSAKGWKRIWCDSTDWWHRWRRLWHSVEFSQIFFTLLPPAHLWLMIFFISKRHQEYIKSDWNFTSFLKNLS